MNDFKDFNLCMLGGVQGELIFRNSGDFRLINLDFFYVNV